MKELTRPRLLHIFAALAVAAAAVIVFNNTVRSIPIFLFLLILAAGGSLELGLGQGSLFGLAILAGWIGAKRVMGVWTQELLPTNVLELATVILLILAGGAYHNQLRAAGKMLAESQQKLAQMELEDRAVGLLRRPVGELRLREEQERALGYGRPLTLLLILVQPMPDVEWTPKERVAIFQAVATLIKDVARETDIPFLLELQVAALLMPETDTIVTQKVVNRLAGRLQDGRYLPPSGQARPIQERAQVRYGFATFLGQAQEQPDMLAAAEESLFRNVKANQGPAFQNLFIDWETLGQQPDAPLALAENHSRPAVFEP